ncbi:DUF3574 domain-containing protein [Streptomyces sp. NPDC001530]
MSLYSSTRARLGAASDKEIEQIRNTHEKAFAQEAVARVDDRARVDF